MKRIVLKQDTVGPVARGHPWVYGDGIAAGSDRDLETGDLVDLLDGRQRRMAIGLVDEGAIRVRVLGRQPMPLARLLAERLKRAQALRAAVLPDDTDCYRVVNGAGDGLPGLVVDRYGDLAILRLYSAAWLPHFELVERSLRGLEWATRAARRLGVDRVDASKGLEAMWGVVPESLVVHEAGLRFLVRPAAGQKTGLFLDQRENRRWVARCCRGGSLVNLFGYNGGFSVHAAAAGARSTVTVDLAPAALEDAKENFRLNDISLARHAFECADAFHWQSPSPADVVVCDPPSLVRGGPDDAARQAYRRLNAHAAAMLAPDGIFVTCSCTARLGEQRWFEEVRRGVASIGGHWTVVHRAFEPPDHPVAMGHPEGRYLKLAALRRL